jgi:DNA-cytosine methyltransferase
MNVLSLFDGISGAMIAINNLNLKVSNYFASEIDTHSINVSKSNFPQIIHLGDIKDISANLLPKIDLLIGGSPCQDLSNAQNGSGLKGGKSRLFYEYVRLLKQTNPKYFLLENVKNKWANIMSDIVGVDFVEINSNLFTAQSRPRYYWTNINYSEFPSSISNVKINDIIEPSAAEKYFYKSSSIETFLKETESNFKSSKDGIIKAFTLPREIHRDHERQRRVYLKSSKSPTLLARADTTKILLKDGIRKITPLECERLQGIPDNHTLICSDTQRYKMVGNGFTVPVIEHFLKGLRLPAKKKKKCRNLTLPLFKDEIC